MDGRIISGDYYNNIGSSGGQLGNSKSGGGARKKKNKRRDAEMNEKQKEYDRKQEIFDASSFPALSPIENGSSNTATTTSNIGGGVGGSSKAQTTSEEVRNQISGYADALRQSNKPSSVVPNTTAMADHRPSSASSIQSESGMQGTIIPSTNEASASSNNAETSTSTSTTNATEALSNLKMSSSSTNSQTPRQSAGEKCEQPHTTNTITTTTIAVGALTGTPTTTTVTKTGEQHDSVSSGLQNTNHASSSTTSDTTITVAKNNNTNNNTNTIRQSGDEPTPKEASHNNNQQSSSVESKASAKVKELVEVGGVEAKSRAIEPSKAGMAESSPSPPSAWGNKRSYIDVARKQS